MQERRIKPHSTSKRELDELRDIVDRDLLDAAVTAISADRRFATAYNAALQAATMSVACSGYRTDGLRHHQTTFEAAEIALGSASTPVIAYFDACRRKRNAVDYDRAFVASEIEAAQLASEAGKFLALVEQWIATHHPKFAKT